MKGPQVMVGYLNRPEATAKVLKDGWYSTGDLGYVDPDGFLKITDRLSRFSKIAGEMVPHLSVESAIMEVTGVDEHHVAVTGVPDPKHGERLCVLYTDLGMSPAEVHQRLTAGPLPKLWIPSVRDFIHVEEIPITATGKIDLQALRRSRLGTQGRRVNARRWLGSGASARRRRRFDAWTARLDPPAASRELADLRGDHRLRDGSASRNPYVDGFIPGENPSKNGVVLSNRRGRIRWRW